MNKQGNPSKGARFIAGILGFILTMLLWALAGILLTRFFTTSETLYNGIARNETVKAEIMARTRETVRQAGLEYGFDPAGVEKILTPEIMEELTLAANHRLTALAETGTMDKDESFHPEGLKEAILADPGFLPDKEDYIREETAVKAKTTLEKRLSADAGRLREVLIRGGMGILEKKVSIVSVFKVIRTIPGVLAAACLALTGIMALILSRRIRETLIYTGGAVLSCGILLLVGLGCYLLLGLRGFFGEFSTLMAAEYSLLENSLVLIILAISVPACVFGYIGVRLGSVNSLERKRVYHTVRSPKIAERLRLAIVSDLHDGGYEDIMEDLRECDAILIPGDLVDRHKLKVFRADRFLTDAADAAPVFYSFGNHERKCIYKDAWRKTVEESPVHFLDDGTFVFRGITIGGLTSHAENKANLEFLDAFEKEEGFKLLLCHHPEVYMRRVKGRNIDLTISGHAHGGQWQFFGRGVLAPGQGFFPKWTHGYYDDGKVLVSRGMTNSAQVPRINNPLELIILTLEPGEEYYE